MVNKAKWLYPERDHDYYVHVMKDSEWTICGLAFEGGLRDGYEENGQKQKPQKLVHAREKINCPQCINIIIICKDIRPTEY